MRRVAWALVLCAGLIPSVEANADGKKTAWHTDFETARAEAARLKLPILIHFYAEWCGPCRQMESTILNAPEVLEACGTRCVAVKVDTDARGDLAAKYGVAALPTDVFVSPDGEVLDRNVGKASRDVYLARMDAANRKYASDVGNLAGGPNRTEEVTKLLTRLASAGGIGLEGYSPVSLTSGKVWREGSPEFAWRHAGVIYFMADGDELEKFKAAPQKYAPQYSGFDPMILSTEKVAVAGSIAYGSFYDGRLHLHASEKSRGAFIKNPEKYPAPTELNVPATVAGKKDPVVASIPAMMGS